MKFMGYCFDKDGQYGDPVVINHTEQLSEFVDNNIEKYHELKIVDADDYTVFHVIDQTLIFPLPEHGSKNNKWNPEIKQFQTTGTIN